MIMIPERIFRSVFKKSRYPIKKEAYIMKNIRMVLLGELLLFVAVFAFLLMTGSYGLSAVAWFIDFPSLIIILLILIPGFYLDSVGWGKGYTRWPVGIFIYL